MRHTGLGRLDVRCLGFAGDSRTGSQHEVHRVGVASAVPAPGGARGRAEASRWRADAVKRLIGGGTRRPTYGAFTDRGVHGAGEASPPRERGPPNGSGSRSVRTAEPQKSHRTPYRSPVTPCSHSAWTFASVAVATSVDQRSVCHRWPGISATMLIVPAGRSSGSGSGASRPPRSDAQTYGRHHRVRRILAVTASPTSTAVSMPTPGPSGVPEAASSVKWTSGSRRAYA